MKEDILNTLRQQDTALRDALMQEEAGLPEIPSDLNARVMQRAAQQPRKATLRRLWPWLVAACVAAFIVVNVLPPEHTVAPQDKGQVAEKLEQKPKKAEPQPKVVETEMPQLAEVKTAKKAAVRQRKQQHAIEQAEALPAEVMTTVVEERHNELAQTTAPKVKMQTLTEHDIPITRPENYKYTPEELAQLRKQADEAYLKWVELELEISKNNLQQTAQQEQ